MKEVKVREVWASNLEFEFSLIEALLPYYSIVSMDTEFPGFIFNPNDLGLDNRSYSKLTPSQNYELMKANVDALNIVQLGITLSNPIGYLPDLGCPLCFIWQFNFRDFDIDQDLYNEDSIQLLKSQGIDFVKNKEEGIDSFDFARLVLTSGLVFNDSSVAWLTFHGAYDFGYLIKILLFGQELPSDIDDFMWLMVFFFGIHVYDMKQMMKSYGIYGGLEKIADRFSVDRVAGKSHQAASDSLLTLQTFFRFLKYYFRNDEEVKSVDRFKSILYGLEIQG